MSEEKQVINYKQQLDDKLWCTKKCRMNAEKRLLSNDLLLNFSNIYYSIFIAILSILSLISSNRVYTVTSVIFSVALVISITFASSLSFKERAEKMKRNYLDINQLERRLKYVNEDDVTMIDEIEKEYINLLDNVENHLEFDYYKFLKYNKKQEFNCKIMVKYCFHKIIRCLFGILIVVLPALLLVLVLKLNIR